MLEGYLTLNFREKDSGIRKGRHFMILKWRLFLFPEATATIRNEVKSMNTQIIAIANQKGGVGYEK